MRKCNNLSALRIGGIPTHDGNIQAQTMIETLERVLRGQTIHVDAINEQRFKFLV